MEKQLNKIYNFYKKNKRMPSYQEITVLFSYKSKSTAHWLVKKLIDSGYITKDNKGKLLPTKNLIGTVKILGNVQAGFPSPAEEELSDTMTLDDYLISNKDATYMLKVSGDSMQDAGIMDGDMVLVDRTKTPKEGDIVIAEVDNAWTIKYFRKNGSKVFLEPANKKYKKIYPEEDLKIEAVVYAVIRKY
ncbi:MAG: transcriptional repressor LexA [Candidatus Magasanikbacteria bacterium]